MPTARLVLRSSVPDYEQNANITVYSGVPQVLKTPSGTVMLDIQGVFNVGESPLIHSELDLGKTTENRPSGPVQIGNLDLGDGTDGSLVSLLVGTNQKLWGTLQKLPAPLAVLDMSDRPDESGEIEVLEVITHKVLFNKRPEPVLSG